MLESGEIPQQETNYHERRKKNLPRTAKLLAYAALAPAAALSIFATGCRDQETKISDQITPTAITRHLETTTPSQEQPIEIKSAGVDIEVDSTITQNISSKGRSIDQDSAAIIEVAQKFPLPSRFTATLTENYQHDRAEPSEGKIYVGRNRIRIETEKFETAHELAHILDAKENEQFLLNFYTSEQISDLKKLREEVLADPTWGRDYPSVEKIMTGKTGANVFPRPESTNAQVAAGTDIDANGIWIEGRQSASSQGFNPFESDIAPSHQYLQDLPQSQSEYSSLEDFVSQNKNIVDTFFASSQLTKYAQEDFYKYVNSGLFSTENSIWTAQTDSKSYLTGRYFRDWTNVLERATNMVLFEKYEKGELEEFTKDLPTSKQEYFKKSFEFKHQLTDSEKFAKVIEAAAMTGLAGPGQEYLQKIAYFNQVNNLPEE